MLPAPCKLCSWIVFDANAFCSHAGSESRSRLWCSFASAFSAPHRWIDAWLSGQSVGSRFRVGPRPEVFSLALQPPSDEQQLGPRFRREQISAIGSENMGKVRKFNDIQVVVPSQQLMASRQQVQRQLSYRDFGGFLEDIIAANHKAHAQKRWHSVCETGCASV